MPTPTKLLKQIKHLGLILISLFLFSSCGTLFCVKKEVPALTITSSVPNSEVYINGKYVGQTPYSHFGDKVNVKTITVKKEGYKQQKQKARILTGWAYVNFIPYPLYNWIWGYFLDRSQSKCWRYKKDVFHFQLEKEQ